MIRIEFKQSWRYFNKGQIIELDDSKSIVFVGDNGSGKSSLMILILINSIRNKLKSENKEYEWYNLDNNMKNLLGHGAYYELFEDFDRICCIDDDSNKDYKYFNLDLFNLTKIDEEQALNASELAFSIDLRSLSHGESSLNQIFDFVDKHNKDKKLCYMFDEPDANLAIKHAVVFGQYFSEKGRLILSLHHPYTISQYKEVYWLYSTYDNDGKRIGTELSKISGKEYVNTMINEGCRILKEQMGISITKNDIINL